MNNWIVITTINSSTKAIQEWYDFASAHSWNLLIVGDIKTPPYLPDGVLHYLSIDDQDRLYPSLSKLLPRNHYTRKNLGYLYAIQNGAQSILDTDDDNTPYHDIKSRLNIKSKVQSFYSGNETTQAVNVYKYFTDQHIWPRGLPLQCINSFDISSVSPVRPQARYNPSIVQFLADKDPDVDAIYRLTCNKEVVFEPSNELLILDQRVWCPFNSQATLFTQMAFPLLYLPAYVPFRMTDIWRSFVAQALLHCTGNNLAFSGPLVYQDRNIHDLHKDFLDEVDGYKHNFAMISACSTLSTSSNLTLTSVYKYLIDYFSDCFAREEIDCIQEWERLIYHSRSINQ